MKKRMLLILILIPIILGLFLLYPQHEYININGTQYLKNPDITTVLLLGIENNEDVNAAEGVPMNGRADTIVLAVINDSSKSVDLYKISRDTAIIGDIYNLDGEIVTKSNMQITLQYNYAPNPDAGCDVLADKLSEILYGTPIDYSVALAMEGIVPIVERMSGVEVYMQNDYTHIHEAFEQGEVINLTGEMAELFLRYRNTNMLGANDERMQRQLIFLQALDEKLKYQLRNPRIEVLFDITMEVLKHISGDFPIIPAIKIATYDINDEMKTLPGEVLMLSGEEFHPNYEALAELVKHEFCIEE